MLELKLIIVLGFITNGRYKAHMVWSIVIGLYKQGFNLGKEIQPFNIIKLQLYHHQEELEGAKRMHERYLFLPHLPGIVTHVSPRACICTHGYEGHNLWHTLYQIKLFLHFLVHN